MCTYHVPNFSRKDEKARWYLCDRGLGNAQIGTILGLEEGQRNYKEVHEYCHVPYGQKQI